MTIGPGASGWVDWKEALWTLNYLQVMHNFREGDRRRSPRAAARLGRPAREPGRRLDHPRHLPRLERHRGLSGRQLHPGARQPGGAVAVPADHQRRHDAGRISPASPMRWPTTRKARCAGLPGVDRGHRDRRRQRVPAADRLRHRVGRQPPARPGRACWAPTPASTRSPISRNAAGRRQPARARLLRRRSVPGAEPDPDGAADAARSRAGDDARRWWSTSTACTSIRRPACSSTTPRLPAGAVTRGATLSTDVAAYTLLALRTARRALDSELTLYSNTTPDAQGIPSPLDAFPRSTALPFAQPPRSADRRPGRSLLRQAHDR